MRRKIILFGPYPPPYGGVAIFVYALDEFFSQSDVDYELKVSRQGNADHENTVLPNFHSVYSGFRTITKNDICIDSSSFFLEYLVYRSAKPFLAWLLLKSSKRFRWIKIIHDATLPTRYMRFEFVHKVLFHTLIKFVDEFIVVNDELLSWLKREIGVRQKVTMIGSLLPLPKSSYNQPIADEYSALVSLHPKWVCSIGTFHPSYGFMHIAEAVEQVRRETGMDIGLLLIDGGFTAEMEPRSKDDVLKHRNWITVLTSVDHAQVLQLMKRIDVFVRGVAAESYGLSKVEALWCETPVVATRAGETHGMLLYEFGDKQELVSQIKNALFDPAVRNDIPFWAERFQKEAEKNLTNLAQIIMR